MCGGISMMGLFFVTAGIASIYALNYLQNKIKAIKAKINGLVLTHNNQIIS
jgi:hypothetical protein